MHAGPASALDGSARPGTDGARIVAYCRGGFELEAAADLERIAARAGGLLEIETIPGAAYVIARAQRLDPERWNAQQAQFPPVFLRSVFLAGAPVPLLAGREHTAQPRADRVTPLLAAIEALGEVPFHRPPWRSVWIEFPDTNDGKALSTLARALGARVEGALRERGHLDPAAPRRLHVFLPAGDTAYVGTGNGVQDAWPLGIARLRMPGSAPSRSTLKLAEAFTTFLGERESTLLRPGLRAVDLGAAPGGWTWQLVQRGLFVTAVDNGPLKGPVASDPHVTHLREDGLRWRPRRSVDWLVCDIVEQPLRIADLVGHWIADGLTRRAIFNLKLPMKKRFDEVARCTQRIDEVITTAGLAYTLAFRHLYHDREEVTGYVARAGN